MHPRRCPRSAHRPERTASARRRGSTVRLGAGRYISSYTLIWLMARRAHSKTGMRIAKRDPVTAPGKTQSESQSGPSPGLARSHVAPQIGERAAPLASCHRVRRALPFGSGACTRAPSASDSFARVIDPGDPTSYVPPVGCTHSPAKAPPESLRLGGYFGDTTRDRNAREAALARVVPGGWAGIWVEGDSFAIALVDTSRHIDAVHALYAAGIVSTAIS